MLRYNKVISDESPTLIRQGSLTVRFHGDGRSFCCDVSDTCASDLVRQLKCSLTSLTGVLGGLRYHIAGANVLCTISKEGGVVSLDVQLANQAPVKIDISESEYMSLLRDLSTLA